MVDDDSEIARHITRYHEMVAQQTKGPGGWPEKFTFPEPETDAEREALRVFADALEQMTGTTVTLSKP